MTLSIIGLGLGDDTDITLRGLDTAKRCDKIYMECYTSVLSAADKKQLERRIGKPIHDADRMLIEQNAEQLLQEAKKGDVALLIIGDPLLATTHIDIMQRAKQNRVVVEVIHNASVFSAVAQTGLQLYKFGKTTSIPFPEKNFHPTTAFDVFKQNQSIDAHTLFLLDLRPNEKKFLTIPQAIDILLEIAKEKNDSALSPKTMAVGCARLGGKNQQIVYAPLGKLQNIDFGQPPYCLIIPTKLHFAEEEFLERFKLSGARMQ